MPSHLDTDPDKVRPDWVRDGGIVGNNNADRLAEIAAKTPPQYERGFCVLQGSKESD